MNRPPLTLLLLTAALMLIASCRDSETPDLREQIYDIRYTNYIASFTSGIIPSNGVVQIVITPYLAEKISKEEAQNLFSFSPRIQGKTEWLDDKTIIFRPSELLPPETIFEGTFDLKSLAPDIPETLKAFNFTIQTVRKDFRVIPGRLAANPPDGSTYSFTGEVVTADFTDTSEVESYLRFALGRSSVEAEWDHPAAGNTHQFTISPIPRSETEKVLTLTWDGSRHGVSEKGSHQIEIPAIDDFSVRKVTFTTGDSPGITIEFTDIPDHSQDLDGLIRTTPQLRFTTELTVNMVTLIPDGMPQGEITVIVEPSIRNIRGETLSEQFSHTITFETQLPSIEAVGDGSIVPGSGELIFPFRAVNLRAVDLTITKIFSDNIPYFLQTNDIDGSSNIRQFGRPVYFGRVDLPGETDRQDGSPNLYSIDIADFITVEPGAIYRVELGMRRSYSLYPCADPGETTRYEELLDRMVIDEGWDEPGWFFRTNDEILFYQHAYEWRERDDPCSEAYYSPNRKVRRNLIASNLGLIAKRGADGILHIMVNDLRTADPLQGVSFDLFDYQMQPLGSAVSDREGLASVIPQRKPFLLKATMGSDVNYLRLNDGSSLSLSTFDVAGVTPQQGIKAFIYGERDVWRPGDTIWLSVIIEEMTRALPTDHPVELELLDPSGRVADRQVQPLGGQKILVFRSHTTEEAQTGNYSARITIGGATFTRRVRVESIKPNRLRITHTFDDEVLGRNPAGNIIGINSRWLSGATAGNLKATVEMSLRPVPTEFQGYSQYNFDDPAATFEAETKTIFDGETDSNGDATFTLQQISGAEAPGMLAARFTTRVFESGGDASITQTVRQYSPYKRFAGIRFPALGSRDRLLHTGRDNEIKIVTLNAEGKPVASEATLNIYKVSYRWWWEGNEEQIGHFIARNQYQPVVTRLLTTSDNGEATATFNIPDEEWGRYYVRVSLPGGHSTGRIVLLDWPWDEGLRSGRGSAATVLSVATDKESYNTGDNIAITFPSPDDGKAIVTIESSTGVSRTIRTGTSAPQTTVNIEAESYMAPNVYVYVTLLQPHAQTANDMPIRLYGVVPVLTEDPQTRLQPVIDMADEVRSSRPFNVEVSEATGKGMSYTLAIVDEGLLDLTGFRTPRPWHYFYAREALGVNTWDMYDQVLGAFGGRLQRVFAVGGDEAFADPSARKASRFRPVVSFVGPATLAPGATNSHTITLPHYTGSVRVMAVAAGGRAYGSSEKQVYVRDPVMLLATAPRVVSPNETVTLPVTLFLNQDVQRNFSIRATGNDLIRLEPDELPVTVTSRGEYDFEFQFTTANRTGVGKIELTAEAGGEKAVYTIEIDVRSPNPPETRSQSVSVRPGESGGITLKPFGLPGTGSATVEISALPPVNLSGRLQFLTFYPHSCTEQVTSGAFPLLYLRDIYGDDVTAIFNASAHIQQAIHTLSQRALPGGGLAFWPGRGYSANSWVTSYVGHFMLEAGNTGFTVPSQFMRNWTNYQRRMAQEWQWDQRNSRTAIDQAYRLYTLALAGSPDRGAMNRMRELRGVPQQARWLLAAAYATAGRPEAARELIDMRAGTGANQYSRYYYGSELRDKAAIVLTLIKLNEDEQALMVLRDISELLSGNEWHNTQATAWGLMAYMKYAERWGGAMGGETDITVSVDGRARQERISGSRPLTINFSNLDSEKEVTLQNNPDMPLFISSTVRGVPAAGDEGRDQRNLAVSVSYVNMENQAVDHRSLQQGTDFIMVVTVRNTTLRQVDDIALTTMMPSGWEIRNTRLFEAEVPVEEDQYDYRDFRDDRVHTYFSLGNGEIRRFVFLLNAAYRGEYYHPAVWCEAMYDGAYYSRIPGHTVRVTGGR